jgi:hypothetical protein
MVGIYGYQSNEDKKLIRLIGAANTNSKYLFIMDARPKANAIGNKVTGAGYEKDYENCILQFMNIQNIHEMRASFGRLFNLVSR